MEFVNGNPELNFFEQNPELRYISEFSDLVKKEGLENASKILWSIYMIEDPKSKLFRMPKKDRIREVKANYYSEYSHDRNKLINVYTLLCIEKEERLYSIHIEKLEELTTELKSLSVSNDKEFNKYIRIMDKLPKIWEALDKVKAKMIEKMNKSNVRGGAKRSSREKR